MKLLRELKASGKKPSEAEVHILSSALPIKTIASSNRRAFDKFVRENAEEFDGTVKRTNNPRE